MAETPVLVIRFGRESYIQWPKYHYDAAALRINGRQDYTRAVGDDSFVVFRGAVKTISRAYEPRTVVTRYTLRPDLVCAQKAEWLTPEQYTSLPEADQPLYQAHTETQSTPPMPLPFRVVDGKGAPRRLPDGVVPILPAHVNVYPWFWWMLPCRATPTYVFGEMARRVRALDPAQFDVTVYENIKTITVSMESLHIGGIRFTPSSSLVRLDRDNGTPSFDGETADDAMAKAHEWCDQRMSAVTSVLDVKTCPCCRAPLKQPARRQSRPAGHRLGHRS